MAFDQHHPMRFVGELEFQYAYGALSAHALLCSDSYAALLAYSHGVEEMDEGYATRGRFAITTDSGRDKTIIVAWQTKGYDEGLACPCCGQEFGEEVFFTIESIE